jgi:hypothetical protein
MEYVIGSYIFKSKAEAKARYSQILKNWDLWETIHGDDEHMLNSLLDAHPWRSSIVGKSRVVGYRLVPTEYRSRSIEAIREDGSSAAFPLTRAFEKRNPNKADVFRSQCRKAVADQIIRFKKAAFARTNTVWCELTGTWITWDECHVDHVYPFEDLIQDFRAAGYRTVADFVEYHRAKAVLRCVSKVANLARGRGE